MWLSLPVNKRKKYKSVSYLPQLEDNIKAPKTNSNIVTLELQGNSFFHGVRFSVHTSSLGRAACLSSEELAAVSEVTPSLLKESLGLVVVLLSIKFSEAQN